MVPWCFGPIRNSHEMRLPARACSALWDSAFRVVAHPGNRFLIREKEAQQQVGVGGGVGCGVWGVGCVGG
jgi:hypothetical protein